MTIGSKPAEPSPATLERNAHFVHLLGDLDAAVRALYAFYRDHGYSHAQAAFRARDAVTGSLRAALNRLRADGGPK